MFLHYANSVGSNYERTYVACALKNVAADANPDRREEYLKLAEGYEKRTIGGWKLMLESNGILSQSNTKKA